MFPRRSAVVTLTPIAPSSQGIQPTDERLPLSLLAGAESQPGNRLLEGVTGVSGTSPVSPERSVADLSGEHTRFVRNASDNRQLMVRHRHYLAGCRN
jgi:hypothetical protein